MTTTAVIGGQKYEHVLFSISSQTTLNVLLKCAAAHKALQSLQHYM